MNIRIYYTQYISVESVHMAQHSLPVSENKPTGKEVLVSVKKFMCVGAPAPFDHPHIFLNMGDGFEKLCPYCSALYRLDTRDLKNKNREKQTQ